MRSSLFLVPSLLAVSSWAAPGELFKKAVCNADNCLRAVMATNAKPFPPSATADCSSFMQKMVTLCPTTSTTITTVIATESPYIVTVTTATDATQLNTISETLTSFKTIEDTLTITEPSAVQVTNTVFSTTTVTLVSPPKRDLWVMPLPPAPTFPDLIKARVPVTTTGTSPGTCAASTNAPTNVPTYASACSGIVRYSSACSCAGITDGTTTLTPSTVVATSTFTSYYTPTSTVSATLTNNVIVTVVQTQTVPATIQTTDATTTIPSIYTETTQVVVPTTVVVSPPVPVCSAYNFVITNGARSGQFVTGGTPSTSQASGYGFVNFTSDASQAMPFTLRSNGRVYGRNTYGWVTQGSSVYYILQMTDIAQPYYPTIRYVSCTIGNGDSSYTGAIGMLACSNNGAAVTLQYCPNYNNNLIQGLAVSGPCTPANLAVIPAPSC